jgi:hypothetical protein
MKKMFFWIGAIIASAGWVPLVLFYRSRYHRVQRTAGEMFLNWQRASDFTGKVKAAYIKLGGEPL